MKISAQMMARPTTPPTTPPAMAPTLVLWLGGVGEGMGGPGVAMAGVIEPDVGGKGSRCNCRRCKAAAEWLDEFST